MGEPKSVTLSCRFYRCLLRFSPATSFIREYENLMLSDFYHQCLSIRLKYGCYGILLIWPRHFTHTAHDIIAEYFKEYFSKTQKCLAQMHDCTLLTLCTLELLKIYFPLLLLLPNLFPFILNKLYPNLFPPKKLQKTQELTYLIDGILNSLANILINILRDILFDILFIEKIELSKEELMYIADALIKGALLPSDLENITITRELKLILKLLKNRNKNSKKEYIKFLKLTKAVKRSEWITKCAK